MAIDLLFLILSYLIGSIPFAYIFTKIAGYGDIRNIGSGNIGFTNVLRTGKKSLASIVLIFDILKGFIPTFYFINFYNAYFNYELTSYFLGSLAIIGHLFPIWLKFKGGKGIATYLGYIFAIDYKIGLIFIIVWLSTIFLKKYSSLASLISLIVIPFALFFFEYSAPIFIFFSTISLVLIFMHKSNIKRLLNKKETKIKF